MVDGTDPKEREAAIAKARAETRRQVEDEQLELCAAYAKALAQRFGPEVFETIRETRIAHAVELMRILRLPKRDLEGIKTLLWDRLDDRFEYEVLEQTPRRLRFRVTRCQPADKLRQLDAAEFGFAHQCAFDEGFCRGLNPAIKFTRKKTLMQGDDCCDHVYELPET
jgi:hypothetical protein